MPEALVVRGTVVTVVPLAKLARLVPTVIVNVTGLLYAGLPEASRSVTLTAAWADMLMLSGLIVSDMLAGVGGGGLPMVRDALLFREPTVAVMFTIESSPAGELAVNVTVATPNASVVALAAGVKFPAPVNVTVTPLIKTDEASRTVADTVVLPPLTMVVVPSETTTEAGIRGGVPMVIGALPMIVLVPTVTVARMVALTSTFAALKVDTAWPDALVTARVGVQDPEAALITEKETLTFGTTCAEAFVTVAVTVAVPNGAILDAESVTWTVVGAPAAPVEAVGGFTDSTPHPLRTTARKMRTGMAREIVFFIIFGSP
jgi:hypothetical protein